MTIINILADGMVYPPLSRQDLVIRVMKGQVVVGKLISNLPETGTECYLLEPANAADIKADVIAYISYESPRLFSSLFPVHLICPLFISARAKWGETGLPYNHSSDRPDQ